MKMTSRDKELIILALSIGIVALSWFYGAKTINARTEVLAVQKQELESEYDERMRILAKKESYLADTKNYNEAYAMMLEHYPAGISQVTQIMFVVGLEQEFETQVTSVSYTEEQPVYTFQSADSEGYSTYILTKAETQIPVQLGYSRWKDFLDYVYSYQEKSTVPQISAAFDPISGKVSATVTLNQYAIRGADRVLEEPEIMLPIGTDNIFKSGTILQYDGGKAEQMEEIKKNYHLYMMLYPAASDVSAKVIADQAESSKVISGKNEEEALQITAQEQEDGTVSVTYVLGDENFGDLQNLSGETIDIYVLSSPRMGGTDSSSVLVTIDNQTSRKMRIAVSGEDHERPRFVVTEQHGAVEIFE